MLNGQFCDPIQTIWVGKGYSLKLTPMRIVELTGVTAVKDKPLSVDLTMFPKHLLPRRYCLRIRFHRDYWLLQLIPAV